MSQAGRRSLGDRAGMKISISFVKWFPVTTYTLWCTYMAVCSWVPTPISKVREDIQ